MAPDRNWQPASHFKNQSTNSNRSIPHSDAQLFREAEILA
jgi:hypothetical protein